MQDTMRKTKTQEHDPFGGSSLGRILLCPASYREQLRAKDLPQPDASPRAQSGTKVHRALAGEDVSLDDQEQELVTSCQDWLRKTLPWLSEGRTAHEVTLPVLDSQGSQTADLVGFKDDWAVVVDFKTSGLELSQESLACQLGSYSLGIMDRYKVSKVDAYAYQPRIDRAYHCTYDDPQMLRDYIRDIRSRAEAADPEYHPSEEACTYCKALSYCEAGWHQTRELVQGERPKPPIDPKRLGELLDLARLAEKRASEVRRLATDLAKEGAEIPGYKLTSRKGDQYLAHPLRAFRKLQGSLGTDALLGIVQFPVAKLKALYVDWWVSVHQGTKKRAAESFQESLEEELDRKPGVQYLRKAGER